MTAVATRSRILHQVLKTPFTPTLNDKRTCLTESLPVNEVWSMCIFPRCDEKTRRIIQRVSRAWCAQVRMYETQMPIRVEQNASVDILQTYCRVTHFTARLPSASYALKDLCNLHRVHTLAITYRHTGHLNVRCLAKIATLRHLSVAGLHGSIAGLGELTQLHSLNIMFCDSSIDSQLLLLKDTLRALILIPTRTVLLPLSDSGVFVSSDVISQMRNLRTFGISGASVEKERWQYLLDAFAKHKYSDKTLMFHDNRELQGYGRLFQHGPDTTTLSLKRSTCVNFDWLNVQLSRFANLTHLSLNGFNSPTATNAEIDPVEIPTLRSLDVVSQAGDMIIQMFSQNTLVGLERLAVYACDYRALQVRAKKLDSLEYLCMKQQNITHTAIALLRLPKLRYIELAICSDFTALTSGPAPDQYCYTRGFYASIPFELQHWLENATERQVPLEIEAFCSTSFKEEYGPIIADDQIARVCSRRPCVTNERDFRLDGSVSEEGSSFHEYESDESDDSAVSSSSDSNEYMYSIDVDNDYDDSSSDPEWHDPTRRKKRRRARTFGDPNERLANMRSDESFSPSLDSFEESEDESSSSIDERRYRSRRRR